MRAVLEVCRDFLIQIHGKLEEIDTNEIDEEQKEILKDIIAWCISIINTTQELLFKHDNR